MNLDERLNKLVNNEASGHIQYIEYTLDNIKKLLKHYNNPHKKIKTIHIAGTNGKGSIAYMLSSILTEAGYKVGLFTSPHLLQINERIQINNRKISKEKLNEYADDLFKILKKNTGIRPTYFDALTLFGFRYFYENKVDIAVIETGLGGRLDSTNLINPLFSIITDISLDHIKILGNTIKEIAWEKAGIIKKNSCVITSNTNPEVVKIIAAKAKEMSSRHYNYNKDFFVKNIKKNDLGYTYDLLLRQKDADILSLKGVELFNRCRFQIKNSSSAIVCSLLLREHKFVISDDIIKKGIIKTKIPGRFHVISKNPLIIFDPAHNKAALKEVISAIRSIYPDKKYSILVTIMKDKEPVKLIRILNSMSNEIHYLLLNDSRCFDPNENKGAKKNIRSIFKNNEIEALYHKIKKSMNGNKILFVTGSFRLYESSKKLASMFRRGL